MTPALKKKDKPHAHLCTHTSHRRQKTWT